jgi:uncharacterized protein (DUF58 family)
MANLIPFVIVLFFIAAFMRLDFLLYILYVFFGLYLLSRWWVRRAMEQLRFRRTLATQRAFLGERVPVEVEVWNSGFLPVPWVHLRENLPVDLRVPSSIQRVISLLPRERETIRFDLHGWRRGYYDIGPLSCRGGDLFGVTEVVRQSAAEDHLIVYPKIIPLPNLALPSLSPFGTLPSQQRLFEDPTRVMGVRDYQAGDSPRRIDWKTSAVVGRLQVRRYQPAISVQAFIMLNLNTTEYSRRGRFVAPELAIVVAASIANQLNEQRQAVGLATNGADPLAASSEHPSLPPRKGRGHLMSCLDLLARVKVTDTSEALRFTTLLRQASLGLSWGSTLVIVTGQEDDSLMPTLVHLRRRGFLAVLLLVDRGADFDRAKARAQQIGVPAYRIAREQDLDVWK